MSRLTERDAYGYVSPNASVDAILNRLALYEDTGYMPNEIKEMEHELEEMRKKNENINLPPELRFLHEMMGDDE